MSGVKLISGIPCLLKTLGIDSTIIIIRGVLLISSKHLDYFEENSYDGENGCTEQFVDEYFGGDKKRSRKITILTKISHIIISIPLSVTDCEDCADCRGCEDLCRL